MKKTVLTAVILMFVFAGNLKADTYGKQNYFGINPLGLLFNIYSGEYGRFLDEQGSSEINVPFVFWAYSDWSYIGIGAKYRMYKDGNGAGVYYGGGLYVTSFNWDYSYWDGGVRKKGSSNWMTFSPKGELGYRWSWPSGWTIAPSIELGYKVSTYKDPFTGADSDYGTSGFDWGLNIGLAFMF